VNFNTNTFVISIGEHLSAIAYQAPWMNGQPINHAQAYLILCAVHEELFNEIFPWARIDNSLQEAMISVYQGFQVLVPQQPRLWRHNGREWQLTTKPTQHIIQVPVGGGLPNQPQPNATYHVHGGVTYDQCFNQFIDRTLNTVRWALRCELNKYLGTQRDYEWYYEYAGNGITYTRQEKAVITYANVEPENETELVQQEINLQPKPEPLTPAFVMINLAENESRGGQDRGTGEVFPDKFTPLLNSLPAVMNQLYLQAMQSGLMRADILIRFVNPVFLREVCDRILELTRHLPVKFTVRSEQVPLGHTPAVETVQRALHQRSLDQVQHEAFDLAAKLTVIRDRIVRRNNVTALDIREINSLEPALLTQTVLNEELYVSVNNREHWYKFSDHNPAELQHPVIGLCLLLSNQIDSLTGYTPHPTPTPTFQVRDETQPIGITPLYCN